MKLNMAKLRTVGDTKWLQLHTEAAQMLKQNVWPVGKITKQLAQQMFNATSKLLDEYHNEVDKRCEELRNESKILHSNILTKPKTNTKFGISNKTTNNSKGDKTMAKINNATIMANIEQLTNAVNKIIDRLDALESKNVAPKQFKKLRETAEEVKKETKKVEKKVAKKNPKVLKLQKMAAEMKESMTKAQLAAYTKMWSKKWSQVNKSIDINKKEERSMAFAKGRIECAKNAIKMF